MKNIRPSILTALYAGLIFLYASCVREDTSACMQYEVNVRVVDAEGNDLTESEVLEKSEVYLFGENGFVRMIPAGVSSDYLFGHYKDDRLTLVAWGNVKEDTLITAEIKPGTPIEEARLKLKQYSEGNHLPVTDLFYCRKELSNTATRGIREESVTLVMERLAAGLEYTRALSDRTVCRQRRGLYLYREGNGQRNELHGKSERRGFGLQTTDPHGRTRGCLYPAFPHLSYGRGRIHRSGDIQGTGEAMHRYTRRATAALMRGSRKADGH